MAECPFVLSWSRHHPSWDKPLQGRAAVDPPGRLRFRRAQGERIGVVRCKWKRVWRPRGAAQFSSARRRVPPKQMGPASLPTPLSPMRGQLRRGELGIRCFAVLLHRSAEIGVCHRRSHRHPDPSSGGFGDGAPGRSPRFLRIPRHQRAAPRSDTRTSSRDRWRVIGSEDLQKRSHRVPAG